MTLETFHTDRSTYDTDAATLEDMEPALSEREQPRRDGHRRRPSRSRSTLARRPTAAARYSIELDAHGDRDSQLHEPGQGRLPSHARRLAATSGSSPQAVACTRHGSGRGQSAALHFVGIGGAGMSGLALVARELGATVTGSDRSGDSSYAARLRAAGIEPHEGHDAANVPAGAPRSSSRRRSRRRTPSG